MTQSTCRQEFPLLYPQIEELKAHWSRQGGITKANVDKLEAAAKSQDRWGWARVVTDRNGKLFVRSFVKGDDTRQRAMLLLLNQALATDPSGMNLTSNAVDEPMLPFDLVISTGDKDSFPSYTEGPSWVLTKAIRDKASQGSWLTPDFGFMGWPEAQAPTYPEVASLQQQVEKAYPWESKDDRIFWRGFPNMYPIRRDLMDRTRAASHLANTDPDAWADVFATSFGAESGPEYRPLAKLEDHCRYRYLAHAEGNSYSGRSKYLFSCHAVTVAHRLEWTQHFHPALITDPSRKDRNFIELPGNGFEGLEEAIRGMWESDADPKTSKGKAPSSGTWLSQATSKKIMGALSGREIADNARDSLRDRYLTPAATMCYYRGALQAYASVQKLETWGHETGSAPAGPHPMPGNGITPGKIIGSPGARGDISFDSFLVVQSNQWPPVAVSRTSTSRATAT
ncbi:unnamed protein product [Jaminaea pallidilutea]